MKKYNKIVKLHVSRGPMYEYYDFLDEENPYFFQTPKKEVPEKLYREYLEAKEKFDAIYEKIAEEFGVD